MMAEPMVLLRDDQESVERLARVMLRLADTPRAYITPTEAAEILIAALRDDWRERE